MTKYIHNPNKGQCPDTIDEAIKIICKVNNVSRNSVYRFLEREKAIYINWKGWVFSIREISFL